MTAAAPTHRRGAPLQPLLHAADRRAAQGLSRLAVLARRKRACSTRSPKATALTASDIARALDLDAGYLSRVLRNFEKRGLIERKTSAKDARQSHLALTARGRRVFAPLEKRSQQQVGGMLGKLKARRAGATGRGDEFDPVAAQRPRGARAPSRSCARPGPAISAGSSPATPSFTREEYGWTDPFEGLCAQIVADFVNKFDAKKERAWIAELNGENVGSIMLAKDSDDVARIRLLLVDPKARGLGLGRASSPTNASDSPAPPATRRSRCGRTAILDRRAPHLRQGRLQADAQRKAQELGQAGRQRALGSGILKVWPPELGPRTYDRHKANARLLRVQAFNAAFRYLFRILAGLGCRVVALLASLRRV